MVHASSSGGTHAGLVAGRALLRSLGHEQLPPVLAVGVAKGVNAGVPDVRSLAGETLALLGADPDAVTDDDVEIDTRWIGADYGEPTAAGDEAIRWAAVHGGWVLDRTYSGKGLAGLLGNAVEGRWRPGSEVVFLHTGGLPAVFAPGGAPVAFLVVSEILDVDLLAFERGSGEQRRAVVDGVRRSLETGFVYTSHDLSEDLLDQAYAMLKEFFAAPAEEKQRWVVPGVHGQTGYTGLLVETAASSDVPDWKEMLNWSAPIPSGHPLKRKFPTAYPDQVLPEDTVPGITKVLTEFHETIADLQRRFLRVIAEGIGCHETFFDEMVADGPTLTRAIRYPPMGETPGRRRLRVGRPARRHQPHHRPATRHRARAAGEGRRRVGRRRGARGSGHHQHRDHAGTAHQRADPHRVAPRRRRPRVHRRAPQRRAVLPSPSVDRARAGAELLHVRSTRSGSRRSPPPTPSTRCSTRSTWSRTPAGSDQDCRRRPAPAESATQPTPVTPARPSMAAHSRSMVWSSRSNEMVSPVSISIDAARASPAT